MTQRRHDLDWLKIFATLAVFVFHCGRMFDTDQWHIKNNEQSLGADIFSSILVAFIMPIFFVLSGSSITFSLNSRKTSQFLLERVKRIFIPLLFGILVLCPPQIYVERVANPQMTEKMMAQVFHGSFFQFLPHYFEGFHAFGGNFAWHGVHLWYLLWLFLLSVVLLPLFLFLKSAPGKKVVSGLARFAQLPGAIFLFVLPLFFVEVSLNPEGLGLGMRNFGGWTLLSYLVLLLLGFVLFSDQRFEQALIRSWRVALIGAILATGLRVFRLVNDIQASFGTIEYALAILLRCLTCWFWLVAFLGLGIQYLRSGGRFFKYASEAVLPFYMLHQTVIVVLAFFLYQLEINGLLKYGILAGASFVVIMLLYEFLVRRWKVMRFFFGIKPKRKPLAARSV